MRLRLFPTLQTTGAVLSLPNCRLGIWYLSKIEVVQKFNPAWVNHYVTLILCIVGTLTDVIVLTVHTSQGNQALRGYVA